MLAACAPGAGLAQVPPEVAEVAGGGRGEGAADGALPGARAPLQAAGQNAEPLLAPVHLGVAGRACVPSVTLQRGRGSRQLALHPRARALGLPWRRVEQGGTARSGRRAGVQLAPRKDTKQGGGKQGGAVCPGLPTPVKAV